MKKFAWLFAALSLCACSFTACGDDDDDSSNKKKNGEACEVAADCESDYCSADKTCAAKPAADDKAKEGEACADKECANGLKCNDSKVCEKDEAVVDDKANKGESCADKECAEGLECNSDKICADKAIADDKAKEGEACADKECAEGLKCNDSKVCEKEEAAADKKSEGEACEKSEECDDGLVCTDVDGSKICLSNEDDEDACVAATHVITCGNPEGVATSYICENSVITPKACNENERCDEGKGCVADEANVECSLDTDCSEKDPSKPYCNDEHVCVAEKLDSNNCGVCEAGVCRIDICVTEAMTKDGAECATRDNDAYFCDGDVFWYCKPDTLTRGHEDCKTAGYGACNRYHDGGGITAQCTGTEEMIAHCTGETAMLCDPEGIDKYKCVKALDGSTMAIYDGDNSTATSCPKGCEYVEGVATCKN